MRLLFLVSLVTAGLAAQQPNTVTATVSFTQPVNPGTTIFQIQFLEATLASTVDTALAGLTTVGVSQSQLVGVNVSINQGFVVTTYDFRVPVAASEFAATRDKLITVQRSLSASQTQALAWTSSQTVSEDQLAIALQQSLPSLLDRAKLRAAALAQAMNATLGNVVSLTTPAISPAGPAVTISLTATYSVSPQ